VLATAPVFVQTENTRLEKFAVKQGKRSSYIAHKALLHKGKVTVSTTKLRQSKPITITSEIMIQL
jgi:hypothetical protein